MRVLPMPKVNVEPGSLKVIRHGQNEGVTLPPPHNQCQSFYESTPSAQEQPGRYELLRAHRTFKKCVSKYP